MEADKSFFMELIRTAMEVFEVKMLITLEAGSMEPKIRTNLAASESIIQFFVLLCTLPSVYQKLREEHEFEVDEEELIDTLLAMAKEEVMEKVKAESLEDLGVGGKPDGKESDKKALDEGSCAELFNL